ncbi:MAG: hypothetical protein QNJ12_18175 [Ilumatobacter sp.]|uniref:hypothetical protein n=1 Tax=Ilumatobacter sp. TaxID=1967498 RepID=UPI0026346D11|nr:hypothetical protein [Ilumatobacter sp.]MDJ0770726.1 hypothetical protein [Ilumatobacter sp.]
MLVVAALVLGACGLAVAEGNLTSSQSLAPMGVEAEADQPGPLVWKPVGFGDAANKAYNLCNDHEAIEAGLDGGALAADRQALGIDCVTKGTGPAFGYLMEDGLLALGTTAATARAAADDLAAHADGDGSDPVGATGTRLGHFGELPEPAARRSAVSLVPGSLTVGDGVVRGLVQNESEDLFARNVRVTLGKGRQFRFPLTVQPGEVAPFEIDGWNADRLPGSAEISVKAALTPGVDAARSVLITGAPGYWHGSPESFPGWPGILSELPATDFAYFESGVEVAIPSSHASVAADVRANPVRGVQAFVAFLDEAGGVMDVVQLDVVSLAGERAADAALGESHMLGFVIPDEAADFQIWVGGSQ